ncbi:MAG: hypothetical protein WCQ20_06600 [Synechococcaceae cyanobacterium ELA739]
MAAQYVRSRLSQPQQQRYTLVFKNGELLRHQDALHVAQYQQDARLSHVQAEELHSS